MAIRSKLTGQLAGIFVAVASSCAQAQTADFATDALAQTAPDDPEEVVGLRNGNVIVVPVPFSSPAVGSGLALGAGYLFKLDPDARTSVVGVGALGTEKGSEAYAALANITFGKNRWLLSFLVTDADLRYDLIFDNIEIPLRQTANLAKVGLAYGVTPDLSFGASVRYLDTDVGRDFDSSLALPPKLQPDLNVELANVSLTADWDLRDDTDYPTDGVRFYGEVMRGIELDGRERRYEKLFGNLDGYVSLRDSTVLTGRATACGASEDSFFFDKCSIGSTDNFRGFNATRFLDDRTFSLQAELRQRFGKRFGGVVFGGVGWSGEDVDAMWSNGGNVAGGLGLRYRVSRKFPVDFSVDVSRNDRDDDLVYIYVGQRW